MKVEGASDQDLDLDLALLDSLVVDAVIPEPSIQYALPARGSIFAKTQAIGGTRGTDFLTDCREGQVLAGVSGSASSVINQVRALCVDVNGTGQWTGTPAQAGEPYGGGGGSAFTQTCPHGHGVVGFTGSRQLESATWATGYLQMHCRKLTSANTTTGQNNSLNSAGTAIDVMPNVLCAQNAVAKGIYGKSGSLVESFGLSCHETPADAGRWSNVIDWPLIPIHAVLTPQGNVMSFGTNLQGTQGAHFHYDVWNPKQGTGSDSHLTLDNTLGVDSFCSAAMIMPDNGSILMAGGDGRPDGAVNKGIVDAPVFDTQTNALSRASNMSFARWYPTMTTLPNGEILIVGGLNGSGQHSVTPEIYSPQTDQWRSLFSANTSGYGAAYPRQWVASDGRIFGVNGANMYYMSVTNQGHLTAAGTLPNVSRDGASTAVMYQPGKILQVGGNGESGGFGAVSIDINSGSPVVTEEEPMAMPRRAWAESQVLPDGTVLIMGGGREHNDANHAALSTELWDPDTRQWTQLSRSQLARLYHSTSVLLPDATVMLAGGGAPGPLINRNAEIFSPPYLYNENGTLRTRPKITIAPPHAAYGETIPVVTNASAAARVTLIKSTAVTHSLNMEQRFLELSFTPQDNHINVQLPANANLATPGYYLLYVLDAAGTPSEAHILKLGTLPAPVIDITPPAPNPPTEVANNLLANGGFEQGKEGWQDCAGASLTRSVAASNDGISAIEVTNSGCLFQELSVLPGLEYTFECDAAINSTEYASLFFQINDIGFNELAIKSQQIIGADYTAYSGTLVTPPGAAFASLGMYSEGASRFDRCSIVAGTQVAEPPEPEAPVTPMNANLLTNGGFEQQKNGWLDCSNATSTSSSSDALLGNGAMQITSAGCLYQEIAISPGNQYRFHCSAKSTATNYTSMSVQITDQSRIELQAIEIPIGNNIYSSFEETLTAPQGSANAALTLYSEDTAIFDNCFVETL